MEQRRTCKLCLKTFSNGRALGGHMRSHMVTLQPAQFPPPPPTPPKIQLGHHHQQQQQQQLRDIETTESASSYSTEYEGEELCYGLRENPKKSFRLVDPEFSFAVLHDAAGSSVVVQDRESETESSKNPIRIRRSKRNRMKSGSSSSSAAAAAASVAATTTTTTTTRFINQNQPKLKKAKSSKPIKAYHEFHEPEPVSSVSDTTPEEDVALCLMMLSRASWDSKQQVLDEDEEEENDDDQKSKSKSIEDQESDDDDDESLEEEEEEEEEELKIVRNRNRPKYQCGTCKKVFRSYQALGGHRASHKKIRGCNIPPVPQIEEVESAELGGNAALPNTSNPVIDRKIHECPVCFRVFGSGQALGGHKRSHGVGLLTAAGSTSTNVIKEASSSKSIKFGDTLIDLNLPAPIEDDDYSQIELSAVSDAEFIDPIK